LQNGVHVPPVEDRRQRATILYGTQTGTAERFAKSLRAQLDSRYGVSTSFEVLDIEHYDAPSRLPDEQLVFLLMATYGDGDPTDSATDFWSWLSDAADGGASDGLLQVTPPGIRCLIRCLHLALQCWCKQLLASCWVDSARVTHSSSKSVLAFCPRVQAVSFGIFGLGNRQYEHFCAMGRKVSKAMRALGATEVVPKGEGDDDRDIDEDFDKWCAQLFAALDNSKLVTKGKVRWLARLGCWVWQRWWADCGTS
jgi:NADPH-ferrihemoprotein reductase